MAHISCRCVISLSCANNQPLCVMTAPDNTYAHFNILEVNCLLLFPYPFSNFGTECLEDWRMTQRLYHDARIPSKYFSNRLMEVFLTFGCNT